MVNWTEVDTTPGEVMKFKVLVTGANTIRHDGGMQQEPRVFNTFEEARAAAYEFAALWLSLGYYQTDALIFVRNQKVIDRWGEEQDSIEWRRVVVNDGITEWYPNVRGF